MEPEDLAFDLAFRYLELSELCTLSLRTSWAIVNDRASAIENELIDYQNISGYPQNAVKY